MNTEEAFKHLLDNWLLMPKEKRSAYRRLPSAVKREESMSETKKEDILMFFGYVTKRETSWKKPLLKKEKKSKAVAA